MKLWLKIICSVGLLLLLMPDLPATPLRMSGKWRAFSSQVYRKYANIKGALKGEFTVKRKFNPKSKSRSAYAAQRVRGIKYERPSPPSRTELSFMTLREIEERNNELEAWKLDPQLWEYKKKYMTTEADLVDWHHLEEEMIEKSQNFLLNNPFETSPMDEVYLESNEFFATRPKGDTPYDPRLMSIEQQVDAMLSEQEDFYFNQLPNSSLLLVRGHIEPTYLGQSIYFYLSIIQRPTRPLYQKIRALTMLGFLGRKGDGTAEYILKSLELLGKDSKDIPWTVDYAAGTALLNLGEIEKFDELVKWRRHLEAGKTTRTPGIAWLYEKVFWDYDLYVQELGEGMPYMRPDTPAEWEIAKRQLQDIREHTNSFVEESLWKLESLDDLVEFLDWKGKVQRIE